jgi:tetratricopeptide (TPR) repeat protein
VSRRDKKKHGNRRRDHKNSGHAASHARAPGRLSDPSGRGFPPGPERRQAVDRIRVIPEGQRTPDAWYTLGSLLVYDACLEDAEELMNEGSAALARAADAEPPVPEAIIDLVWLLNLRGLPALALSYAKRATEHLPDRRDAWRFRANTHMQLKQREQAIECLRRAVALPSSIPADRETLAKWEAGEFDGGRGVLLFGPGLGELALNQRAEVQEEVIKLTLFYCRQMLQLTPDEPFALYTSAFGHYKLAQYEQSERHLAQLFRVDAAHADGLCLQALIKAKQGNTSGAEEFYERAIKANPDHVIANSNLAKILMDEHGKVREAQLLLERALQADPKYAPALSMFGNTIAHLDNDFKREAEYHAKAIEYGPVHPNFRICYLMSLLQAGDFYRLQKEWRRHGPHLAQLPPGSEAETAAGMLQFIVPIVLDPPADFGTCVVVTEKAMHMLGGNALSPLLKSAWRSRHTIPSEDIRLESYGWLGMLAGHCGQHELSLEVFREAERLEGRRGEASLNVAVSLGRLGRFDEAIALARTVAPGTHRKLSIEANLLRDAGRPDEAIQTYLRAGEAEPDFPLPVSNGMQLAVARGDMEAVRKFATFAEQNLWETPEGQYSYAKGQLAMGFPSEAAEVLVGLLYEEGMPRGLPEPEESQQEEDLTVLGELDDDEMFFTLALAFLKCRRFGNLIQLGDWMQEHRGIHGDWLVLVAEANRLLGANQKAIEIIEGMQLQPPPLATKALLAAADGVWQVVRDSANLILSKQFAGKIFFHPEGRPDAVAFALRALNMVAEGYPTDAIDEAKQALQADCTCGLAYAALARAYDDTGETAKATEVALDGLTHVPGDSGLLEWLVTRLVDLGRAEEADEVLASHRPQLESRGAPEIASWLGEQVARARMAGHEDTSCTLDLAWLSQLEPASREWLSAAVANIDKVAQLRIGIALYYCKVVEQELASKLIRPFVDSGPRTNPSELDSDLRDIQRCLDDRRMPGLGSVAHAVRVAFRPARPEDSTLLSSWRNYLRGIPEPRRSAIRMPEFTDMLRMLADVRNRVAHLGDLTHDEFVRVEQAVLAGQEPGHVLRVLGIGLE